MHMNVQNLHENYTKLLTFMKENGYSHSYIYKLKCEINRILSAAKTKKWSSYKDVYLGYAQQGRAKTYLDDKRSILGTIERFDNNGQYPDGHQHKGIIDRAKYPLLVPEFKYIIDNYCQATR